MPTPSTHVPLLQFMLRQSSIVMSHDLPVKSPTHVHVKPLVASGEHTPPLSQGVRSHFTVLFTHRSPTNPGRHSSWKLSSMLANPNLPEYCCGVVLLAPAIISGGNKGTRNISTNSSIVEPKSRSMTSTYSDTPYGKY